jgi:Calcium-activated chloride channel
VDAAFAALLKGLPDVDEASVHEQDFVLSTLKRLQILDVVHPVHSEAVARKLDPAMLRRFPRLDAIRDYYGEATALYFAWMTFMFRWLCVPAILGLAVSALDLYYGAHANSIAIEWCMPAMSPEHRSRPRTAAHV